MTKKIKDICALIVVVLVCSTVLFLMKDKATDATCTAILAVAFGVLRLS